MLFQKNLAEASLIYKYVPGKYLNLEQLESQTNKTYHQILLIGTKAFELLILHEEPSISSVLDKIKGKSFENEIQECVNFKASSKAEEDCAIFSFKGIGENHILK